MTDRLRELSDEELGRALAALGRDLDYPTADVSASVTRRLRARPRHGLLSFPQVFRGRRVAVALAAVLLLATGAVAGGLLVRGVRIVLGPQPEATPGPGLTGPLGRTLFLGEEVPLEDARRSVEFEVRLPSASGLPQPVVYVDDEPPGGRVSLVYPTAPGLPDSREHGIGMLLMQFDADIERPFLEKLVEATDFVREVRVGDAAGYWIEGEHTVAYLDRTGALHEERSRVAGNTLLWTDGGVTFRLESALSLEEALRIAESID